jgi:hypothetical protein
MLIIISLVTLGLVSERPVWGNSQTDVTTTITALTVEPNPDVLSQNYTIGNLTFPYVDGGAWSNLTVSATIQPPPPNSTDIFQHLSLKFAFTDGGTATYGPYTSSSNGSVSFTWRNMLVIGNVTITLSFPGEAFSNNSIYYLQSASSVILSVQPPPTPVPTSTPPPTATPISSSSPIPTMTAIPFPTPVPTNVPATTVNGSIIDLSIGGNITSSQMSSVTIVTNQSSATTTVAFTLNGQSGTVGFGNMTIPKSAVRYGSTPIIYIDNQAALNQGFTQDADNYTCGTQSTLAYTKYQLYSLSLVFKTQFFWV